MRTIKFRAWDKLDKSMYSIREIDFLADGIINSIRTVVPLQTTDEDIDFDFPIRRNNEYELMQFTGLKDKNGKEIYEGDIIKKEFYTNYSGKAIKHESIGIVKFEERKFTSCFYILYHEIGHFQVTFNESIEVIGNVYETPELLKE